MVLAFAANFRAGSIPSSAAHRVFRHSTDIADYGLAVPELPAIFRNAGSCCSRIGFSWFS